MFLFEKILVPLDGSEHSLRAVEIAIQIAKKFDGQITLLHVYAVDVRPIVMPEPTTLTPPSVPIMAPADFSKVIEAARKAETPFWQMEKIKLKLKESKLKLCLRRGTLLKRCLKPRKMVNST